VDISRQQTTVATAWCMAATLYQRVEAYMFYDWIGTDYFVWTIFQSVRHGIFQLL